MKSSELRAISIIKQSIEDLKVVQIDIDSIKAEARTPEVDVLLKSAADSVYEALEHLSKIDLEQYNHRTGGYTGEHIKIFRHRKKKI